MFSKWNFCRVCVSDGSVVGLLFSRVNVHWVEFSLISWLHCVGVGANVISIA
jgi:hypothetical protein